MRKKLYIFIYYLFIIEQFFFQIHIKQNSGLAMCDMHP